MTRFVYSLVVIGNNDKIVSAEPVIAGTEGEWNHWYEKDRYVGQGSKIGHIRAKLQGGEVKLLRVERREMESFGVINGKPETIFETDQHAVRDSG